jgi:hypothetical protein
MDRRIQADSCMTSDGSKRGRRASAPSGMDQPWEHLEALRLKEQTEGQHGRRRKSRKRVR